jgi:serine/threonine protein kinase
MTVSNKEINDLKRILKNIAKQERIGYRYIIFEHGLSEHFGYVKKSEGGYATVFIIPGKDYIIKVLDKDTNLSYTSYARFCKRYHKEFPNVPKIYASFETKDYEFYIVEKLIHNRPLANKFGTTYEKYVNNQLRPTHRFYPLFKRLDRLFKAHGSCTDVGGNNVMFRSNGTAVLTDPIDD